MPAELPHDGPDTALARRLHEEGLVPLETLRGCLEEARAARGGSADATTLAEALRRRGAASPEVLARLDAPAPPGGRPGATGPRLAPGEEVGRYRVEALLGAGGMGEVFRARDAELGTPVALKVLLPSVADGEALARFEREVQLAARVGGQGGVVRVHSLLEHRGLPCVVMQHVAGSDLESHLQRGPLPPRELAGALEQVARTLAACHAHGILHRDVKPSNVLLREEDGAALLADFGLARAVDAERLTRTGDLLGTPAYMAPEQLGEGSAQGDGRSDVYALGAVLYRALAGRAPYAGSPLEVLHALARAAPPRPSEVAASVDPDLEAVCLRAMARSPDARYPDARALAEDLARVRRGEPLSGKGPGRGRVLLAAAGALLLASGLLAGAALLPEDGPSEVADAPTPWAVPEDAAAAQQLLERAAGARSPERRAASAEALREAVRLSVRASCAEAATSPETTRVRLDRIHGRAVAALGEETADGRLAEAKTQAFDHFAETWVQRLSRALERSPRSPAAQDVVRSLGALLGAAPSAPPGPRLRGALVALLKRRVEACRAIVGSGDRPGGHASPEERVPLLRSAARLEGDLAHYLDLRVEAPGYDHLLADAGREELSPVFGSADMSHVLEACLRRGIALWSTDSTRNAVLRRHSPDALAALAEAYPDSLVPCVATLHLDHRSPAHDGPARILRALSREEDAATTLAPRYRAEAASRLLADLEEGTLEPAAGVSPLRVAGGLWDRWGAVLRVPRDVGRACEGYTDLLTDAGRLQRAAGVYAASRRRLQSMLQESRGGSAAPKERRLIRLIDHAAPHRILREYSYISRLHARFAFAHADPADGWRIAKRLRRRSLTADVDLASRYALAEDLLILYCEAPGARGRRAGEAYLTRLLGGRFRPVTPRIAIQAIDLALQREDAAAARARYERSVDHLRDGEYEEERKALEQRLNALRSDSGARAAPESPAEDDRPN